MFWYTIDFEWTDREWKYMPHDALDVILMMQDQSGYVHEVERLSHFDACQMLGVRQHPDGLNTMEAEYLRKVAKIWRDEIGSGSWTGQRPG